jgi:uncharacterized repeat protein (TIGR03803 family)
LVQGSDGNFYGTTSQGGMNAIGIGTEGTVLKITTNGVLTTLYCFTGGDVMAAFPKAAWCRAATAISMARLRGSERTLAMALYSKSPPMGW